LDDFWRIGDGFTRLQLLTDDSVGGGDFFYVFVGFGNALDNGSGAAGVEFDYLPLDGFSGGDFLGEGIEQVG